MKSTCTICAHADRERIDADLVRGSSYRATAEKYTVGRMALQRHRRHLDQTLIRAHDIHEVARADDLLAEVRGLLDHSRGLLARAERKGHVRDATAAIREARSCLELLARLAGELQSQSVTLVVSPQWIEVKTVILASLLEYPQALQAVETALGRMKNV